MRSLMNQTTGEEYPVPQRPGKSGVVFLQRVGKHKLRQARELRRISTDAENILWQRVRGNRVAGVKIRRQQVIEGFIVDFFCNAAKLVIEIDGDVHNDPEQRKKDVHRRKVFEARGLMEIRFKNQEVISGLENVIAKIEDCVRKRITE